MQNFPRIPGVESRTLSPNPGFGLAAFCVNKSGADRVAGEALILDTTVANNAPGLLMPLTTTTSASTLGVGVVDADSSTVPDGGTLLMQVSGLAQAYVDNSGGALTKGDLLTTGTAAGVLAKTTDRRQAIAVYLDADYNSSAALKQVFVINPMGLPTG